MQKNTLLWIFICLIAPAGFAQDSGKILDELSAKAKTFDSIYAEYSSRLLDEQNGIDLKQEGSIRVKGKKYNLELGDYVLITDGETHWTYENGTNDCYVDYLEDVEGDSFSPSEMFTIWEKDFKHEYKGSETVNGKSAHWINLYPNDPADKTFHTIQLFVDKSKMEIVKIVVKGREGNDVIYNVKTFKPNAEISPNKFKFNASDYPGVNVIDNRL